jgi:hypothetical protein
MGKPTPGPWHFVPRQSQQGREHSDWVVAGSDGHDWICLGPEWDADCCDEANANARLIAAAPDLLSAAYAIDGASEYMEFDPDSRFGEALSMIVAAIAKAVGHE